MVCSAALRCARSLAARHAHRTTHPRACAAPRRSAKPPGIRTRDHTNQNNSPFPLDHFGCTIVPSSTSYNLKFLRPPQDIFDGIENALKIKANFPVDVLNSVLETCLIHAGYDDVEKETIQVTPHLGYYYVTASDTDGRPSRASHLRLHRARPPHAARPEVRRDVHGRERLRFDPHLQHDSGDHPRLGAPPDARPPGPHQRHQHSALQDHRAAAVLQLHLDHHRGARGKRKPNQKRKTYPRPTPPDVHRGRSAGTSPTTTPRSPAATPRSSTSRSSRRTLSRGSQTR